MDGNCRLVDSSLGARVGSGKKFTTDTVPAMLSVLFEIELGRGEGNLGK